MAVRRPSRALPRPARAVVFDLYITLTDFDAERKRPAFAAALADALGVDPDAFAVALRASFKQRATGSMGDVRALARRCVAMLARSLTA